MKKRILSLFLVAIAFIVLAACTSTRVVVTFDSDGGTTINDVRVAKGKTVAKPSDPTKEGYVFDGWLLNEEKFDFETEIENDVTLIAKWVKTHKVVFDLGYPNPVGVPPILTIREDAKVKTVTEPKLPVRDAGEEEFKLVKHWVLEGETEAFDFETEITGDVTLVAVWADSVEVAFDIGYNMPNPDPQYIFKGEKGKEPHNPTRDGYEFLGWYLDNEVFDFETELEENVILKAKWEGDENYATLSLIELPGKTSTNLTLPTAGGITWTSSKPEIITNTGNVTRPETGGFHAVKLTATLGEHNREIWVTVFAEDVDVDATYSAAFSEIQTLNPLMSTGSADSDVYGYLVDYLYGADYDWEDAMAEGYADFPGDFSKVRSDRNPNGTVEIPSIKMKRMLGMAAAYPYAVNVGTDNVIPGSFGVLLDQDAAKATLDDTWVIRMREDLVFADGTPINTDVFSYSFRQYLNPNLNNERANYLYNKDYINLVNGKNYFDKVEGITWTDVGFKKLDEFSFEITLETRQTQYHVMTYLGIINLVHPTSFGAGFISDEENNYGSINNPLVSYGAYTLANDYDDAQKFTFTRNETYFQKWDYTIKTINGPIIKDQNEVINEFKAKNLDAAGVGGEFWDDYKDDPNLYVAPSNSFYRIAISLDRGENATREGAPILKYADFRRALYLATDREDFANNIQPPSQGALGYLSNIHQVTEWAGQAYAASDIFYNQLDDLGLHPEVGGYNLEEAKDLFDEARAEAIAAGVYDASEKIVVQFSYYDAGSNVRIANWIKAQYEKVFNEGEPNVVFEILLNPLSSDELNQQRNSGDFDLVFTGMSGATFQATFGMGFIFSPSYSTFLAGEGHGVPTLEVEADIFNLFDIVSEKVKYDEEEVAANEGKLPEGMRTKSEQYLYDVLEDTEGTFEGTFDELFDFWNDIPEFAVDYDGQEEDLHRITAGLERALLKQMIAVPLFSATSAAVLSERIVRIPHAYSLFLGWGGMTYMYVKK